MQKNVLLLALIIGMTHTITAQTGFTEAQELQKLVASDQGANDLFGFSVSISGDYAIVGANGEDENASGENTAEEAGSAYVFERDGDGNWREVQKLVASDRGASDYFGRSVSISGDYAIVGADGEDEDASGENTATDAGSAYVFERDADGNWNEVQKLVASDRGANDFFGWSVSISGDYAIVGADGEDENASGENTAEDAGSAYIFERDGDGNWSEVQKLVASDRGASDYFGRSVSISGDYAVVGAYYEGEAGSAYIFERDGDGNWREVQKLVASDRGASDYFGRSVSISGDYAIVGADGEDEDASGENTATDAGSAYVFERDADGNWNEVQKLVASDRGANDFFGWSVSISGDYAIVGAVFEDEDANGGNTANDAGSAYVFERAGDGNWSEVQKLVASDRDADDYFGFSVSISGDYAIVGASLANGQNASGAGSAYVFDVFPLTITLSTTSASTNSSSFTVTFTFSEAITGFEISDIVVGNGTASDLTSTNASVYTATITPTTEGEVTIDVAAEVAQDGAGNGNTAATQLSVTYDSTAPTVAITSADEVVNAAFTATITFSEAVTGFEPSDIVVGNGTTSDFASTSASVYTATITPTAEGVITIDVAADAAQDGAGNGNTAANRLSVVYDMAPTIAITSAEEVVNAAFTATITFSEDVTGFEISDIAVGNGTASDFTSTSASVYTATITPTADGEVTIDVAAEAAQDGAGNGNTAATQLSVTYEEAVLYTEDAEYETVVYPIPTDGPVTVVLAKPSNVFSIAIVNSAGQTIKSVDFAGENRSTIEMDFSWLETGVYFLNIQSDSHEQLLKVIKN